MGKHTTSEKVFYTAYLGLGTNLGDKLKNLQTALSYIENSSITITKSSAIYETEAWGKTDQPSFYNQAVEITTTLNAEALVDLLLEIEKNCGRVRFEKWGSRIIDIDILYFEQEIIVTEKLKIPHPELHKRLFALQPLAEIAPLYKHPVLNLTTLQLIEFCDDKLEVKRVSTN